MNYINLNYIKYQVRLLFQFKGSLRGRAFSGVSWSMVGSIGTGVFQIVFGIVVARRLSQAEYGAFGTIDRTILMLGSILGLGFGVTLTKYVAEFRKEKPVIAGRIIGLSYFIVSLFGLLGTIILLAFSEQIASNILNDPMLIRPLRVGALFLLTSTLFFVQQGILAGLERFDQHALVKTSTRFVGLVVVAGLAGFGINGALFGLAISYGFSAVLGGYLIRRQLGKQKIPVRINSQLFHAVSYLRRFTFPAFFANLIGVLMLWLADIIIVRQPDGLVEIAGFNAARNWRTLLVFVPGVINQTFLPLFSSTYAKSPHQFRRLLAASISLVIAISVVISIPLLLFPESFMAFYGRDYVDQSSILRLLVLSTLLFNITSPIGTSFVASGNIWGNSIINIVTLTLLVILAYKQRELGGLGLASAYVGASLIHFVMVLGYFIYTRTRLEHSLREEA